MNYVVFDIETDGFNPTKIHCLSMNWGGDIRSTGDYDKMRSLVLRDDITLVGHNIQLYDIPALERLLGVEIKCPVVDTLAVSWYLYSSRGLHGLESWGEDFGYPKVKVDDSEWVNMSYERAVERCEQDVVIGSKLWDKQLSDLKELYGDDTKTIESLLRYLSFKMYVFRIQEQNPFTLDVKKCEENLTYLEGLKEEKVSQLKAAMPSVGVKSVCSPPAKPYKKDGGLSSTGLKWKKLTEERGLPFEHNEPIEVVKDYDEPNPNSPTQIKDWLFSIGWKPKIFTEGANGKVPQIYTQNKELCDSVKKLDSEAVEYLEGLGVLKHRIGLLKGFLRDQKNGRIYCGIHGFASTLRSRHKFLVNLPKPSVPYGDLIRGVLTCEEGYELVDSDLASLENMIKLDLIYPLNPQKVKEQLTEDYDSHLEICMLAGLMTQDDVDYYKDCKANKKGGDRFHELDKIRHKGKTVNYSAQYGVGKKKLAETLEIKQSEAKALLDAYWEANKEAKTVASKFKTKDLFGKTWIQNPYNKYWYELRSEKDRLSAVIQSTGDFITHLWAKYVMDVSGCMSLVYHDQLDLIVKTGYRKGVEKLLRDSIEKVNKVLKLNVPMDISVNFGKYFNEIH